MAVAYQTSAQVTGNFVTSITTPSFTVSGSDTVLVAGVGRRDTNLSSVSGGGGGTWASVISSAVNRPAELRRSIAPAAGSQTVTATFSNGDGTSLACVAVQFTGADQTTPCQDANSANGTSSAPSVTVSNTTADDFVIDCCHHGALGASGSPGANQTERGSNTDAYAQVSTQDGADGGVMSWSSSESLAYDTVACRIVAAAGGGGAAGPLVGGKLAGRSILLGRLA